MQIVHGAIVFTCFTSNFTVWGTCMVSQAHIACNSGNSINKHGKRVIHNGTNNVAGSLNKQTKQFKNRQHSKRNKTWNTVSGTVVYSKGGSRIFLVRSSTFDSENTVEILFVANYPPYYDTPAPLTPAPLFPWMRYLAADQDQQCRITLEVLKARLIGLLWMGDLFV